MHLIVYANYGRTVVYQMQQLMRMVNNGVDDMDQEIRNTRTILSSLPGSNWINLHPSTFPYNISSPSVVDTELYDLLLHKRDVSYSIPDLHSWIKQAGLHFVDYCNSKER